MVDRCQAGGMGQGRCSCRVRSPSGCQELLEKARVHIVSKSQWNFVMRQKTVDYVFF